MAHAFSCRGAFCLNSDLGDFGGSRDETCPSRAGNVPNEDAKDLERQVPDARIARLDSLSGLILGFFPEKCADFNLFVYSWTRDPPRAPQIILIRECLSEKTNSSLRFLPLTSVTSSFSRFSSRVSNSSREIRYSRYIGSGGSFVREENRNASSAVNRAVLKFTLFRSSS